MIQSQCETGPTLSVLTEILFSMVKANIKWTYTSESQIFQLITQQYDLSFQGQVPLLIGTFISR